VHNVLCGCCLVIILLSGLFLIDDGIIGSLFICDIKKLDENLTA
jgi:hypothetical protein